MKAAGPERGFKFSLQSVQTLESHGDSEQIGWDATTDGKVELVVMRQQCVRTHQRVVGPEARAFGHVEGIVKRPLAHVRGKRNAHESTVPAPLHTGIMVRSHRKLGVVDTLHVGVILQPIGQSFGIGIDAVVPFDKVNGVGSNRPRIGGEQTKRPLRRLRRLCEQVVAHPLPPWCVWVGHDTTSHSIAPSGHEFGETGTDGVGQSRSEQINVEEIANRVVHDEGKVVCIGQFAQPVHVGTLQQRIGRDFGEEGTESVRGRSLEQLLEVVHIVVVPQAKEFHAIGTKFRSAAQFERVQVGESKHD